MNIEERGTQQKEKWRKVSHSNTLYNLFLITFIVYYLSTPPLTKMKATIRLRFSFVWFTDVSPATERCLRHCQMANLGQFEQQYKS